MDLDEILRLHPQLVLVDELAHSNPPGFRHAKRYQDVEELLEAGIDVYTTLNIQHLESLHDVVAKITSVIVRETIPDRVIDEADEIELMDLPPVDLLQRLSEGKVYVADMAERALNQFFNEGNLFALREYRFERLQKGLIPRCLNTCRRGRFPVPGRQPNTSLFLLVLVRFLNTWSELRNGRLIG
jgi:two-component system sensor histidine kinase KdpD